MRGAAAKESRVEIGCLPREIWMQRTRLEMKGRIGGKVIFHRRVEKKIPFHLSLHNFFSCSLAVREEFLS